MENFSYSSYPDSVNSSPRSREIDCENASWDDQPPSSNSNYKVKFMCSYGGKILPRPHDNQLAYVSGETKILSVDRNIRFSNLVAKLSSLSDCDVCFKYQLPGEDLDALISVTNDEDLEHMMLEYDRLYRGTAKPARLRLFLFPLSTPATSTFGSTDSKTESQWFVDALNSVQLQNLDVNSPTAVSSAPAPANNPDFLFGLDKGQVQQQQQPPPVKVQDPTPPPPVPEVFVKEFTGSDAGSEDRHIIGENVISPADYQRQIHEMQRLQQHISNQEQAMYNRKIEESIPRVYPRENYQQKAPPPQQTAVPVTNPASFWPERHMTTGPYPASAVQTEQPVYIVQTPTGVYQTPAMRPVTSQIGGQAYYGMQRVMPEVYREQPVYGGVPPQPTIQQPKMGGVYTSENMGMVRPHAPPEPTYTQVGYDSVGRQVYYTAPAGVMQQQMQHPAVVDGRQSGGALNPDGRIIGKP
ncbi:uncharacterized protein LOC107018173 isoform X2 [Solanum pennellii]|uniref:Uncharacterized protein LOC107018173 isoform X1 n=1 Tax=Solanum pennellii TaxID=28526 RepID=A0ABM1GPI6_SOLPN|nr:uncharacterized protein LOC107018173 isoform X1 [Solanum pennellii]XP_015074068.1 uncharacterized protein LOC107018173 isoform X2 [Solanum pennellii]